jgi:hypothetical protein
VDAFIKAVRPVEEDEPEARFSERQKMKKG